MALARRHPRFTVDEYLEFDAAHAERFEYADGLILAMSGASLRHVAMTANLQAALRARVQGRCLVLASDQRVATGDGLYTYPDVVMVCGPPVTSRHRGTETLHNPVLLGEVLSPSTAEYDQGEKLERYQSIPTLRHVLLVDPDAVDVRHVRRTAAGWEVVRQREAAAVIELDTFAFPVGELYEGLP